MENHFRRDSGKVFCPAFFLRMAGRVLIVLCFLLAGSLKADAATLSGDSRTFLRLQETADERNLYPLYEYLNLSLENEKSQGSLSYNIGGWGRVDLGDNREEDRAEGALQHANISYRGNQGNLAFTAGRQFIAEGVGAERIDGLYLRNDLKAGFTAAAYIGSPVVTEPNFDGGDLIYGVRIAHSYSPYYTIGISALKTDKDSERLREEMGIDLWAHPFEKLDIVGRSSYNSITSGWMEHAYNVAYAPLSILRINANLSSINYRDYFHNVTTTALSLTAGPLDPREEVLTLGGSMEYLPYDYLSISLNYKNYDYDIAGPAQDYGGKVNFYLPESFSVGFAFRRMNGEERRLEFEEYRLFASKTIGKTDFTVDIFDVHYDNAINGRANVYSLAVAVGYAFTERLKVTADIDYGKTTELDDRLSGLVKLTYYFDRKLGRTRSEN